MAEMEAQRDWHFSNKRSGKVMRDKDIWTYTLLFLICALFAAEVVLFELTGTGLVRKSNVTQTTTASVSGGCTDRPSPVRPTSSNDQLKIVQVYEQVCEAEFIDDMMIFTNMPISNEVAVKLADDMTVKLRDFESFNISPILIVEPDSEWGLIDFNEFATGLYDSWIDVYFARLKSNGVTEKQLGLIVPFPEPQQDFWNNNKDPDDFAKSINRYFKIVRKYYPKSRNGILLDSQVSEKDSSQLIAYTRLIEPNLISTVGLQGFPWHPYAEGDSRASVTTAEKFIPAEMLDEVAQSLGVKDVLMNTGSYRHRRAEDGGNIAIPTQEREAILNTIVQEAKRLKDKNYTVTVNVFAENKLMSTEGVNWSYWDNKNFSKETSSHSALFRRFITELKSDDIRISIFDR